MTLNQSWGWLTNWGNHMTRMWVCTYLDNLLLLSPHCLECFYTDNFFNLILMIYLYLEAVWRMICASKHLHFMQSFAVFMVDTIGCTCRHNDWSLHNAQRHVGTFWGNNWWFNELNSRKLVKTKSWRQLATHMVEMSAVSSCYSGLQLRSLASSLSTRQLLRIARRLAKYPQEKVYDTVHKACLAR